MQQDLKTRLRASLAMMASIGQQVAEYMPDTRSYHSRGGIEAKARYSGGYKATKPKKKKRSARHKAKKRK